MNLLFYFQRQSFAEGLALQTRDRKIDTYRHFYRYAESLGFSIFIGNQEEGHVQKNIFKKVWKHTNGSFIFVDQPVIMDVVFDRSSSKNITPKDLYPFLFNTPEFKKFCASKEMTYEKLASYMPKSVVVKTQDHFTKELTAMSSLPTVVVKPVHGMKGAGIYIDTPQRILNLNLVISEPYIVQEFVDTSKGIPGITNTYHDIRAIIINNQCVLTSVRTPQTGSLLANVAQGGSIHEIPFSKLSGAIHQRLDDVKKIIHKQFPHAFYSIDFGVNADGAPYIFELNDRIDFPDGSMENAHTFAKELATALHAFSQRITQEKTF